MGGQKVNIRLKNSLRCTGNRFLVLNSVDKYCSGNRHHKISKRIFFTEVHFFAKPVFGSFYTLRRDVHDGSGPVVFVSKTNPLPIYIASTLFFALLSKFILLVLKSRWLYRHQGGMSTNSAAYSKSQPSKQAGLTCAFRGENRLYSWCLFLPACLST